MPRRSSSDVAARRRALIDLLASHDGVSPAEMLELMKIRVARRTLHEDLAFLKAAFPSQVCSSRSGGAGQRRPAYRWQGPVPHLLTQPLAWLSDEELLGLVAARGLLHHDDKALPATSGTARSLSGLAGSIHNLIQRAGVGETARHLGRHLVSVSRFGAAPVDPNALATCIRAAATNQAISFAYTNLAGTSSLACAVPQRLILIRGEWYCVAWARILRMFRLARMAEVAVTTKGPPNIPKVITSQAVDDLLALSFYATGSMDPQARCRVVLAVSPAAWPFLQGRTWGQGQRIDTAPKDLPQDWRRLSFSTTGIAEVRHWVLGMGNGVRAEQPVDLVVWMRDASLSLVATYRKKT